jgi:argininosuccinate synthase
MNERSLVNKLAVLAFSGGLDTSFCVLYLKEQGYDVATVTVNTGGFSPEELARIEAASPKLGALSHTTVDARAGLFDGYLRYLVYGNVLRGQMYPLSVSAERVCQARAVAELAKAMSASAIAHGSTGAGNDQVRFDVAFRALAPELEILTPIRDLGLSRAEEMAYCAERGVVFPEKTKDYSINEGMWGTSIGGRETLDAWTTLPEAAFPGGVIGSLTPKTLVLSFDQGVPVALDGQVHDPVDLIAALNTLGHAYGIGRGVHLGDTILGIKGSSAPTGSWRSWCSVASNSSGRNPWATSTALCSTKGTSSIHWRATSRHSSSPARIASAAKCASRCIPARSWWRASSHPIR